MPNALANVQCRLLSRWKVVMVVRASLEFWKALRMCFLGVSVAVFRADAGALAASVGTGVWAGMAKEEARDEARPIEL